MLNAIDRGQLGFTLILSANNKLEGIIGNGDLRRGLLNNIDHLDRADVSEFVNTSPLVISENYTVYQLLRFIKTVPVPVLYLPVVNSNGEAVGTVNFINLIKGEI